MKTQEYSQRVIKKSELLYLFGIEVKESNLSGNMQIILHFVDSKNLHWTHYQLVDEKNLAVLKFGRLYFSNMGFNMVNARLDDLARTYFENEVHIGNLNGKEYVYKVPSGRIFKCVGRCYYGKLVRRVMKGEAFKDGKKHTYFDVDFIYNSRYLDQEKLLSRFKELYGENGWNFDDVKYIDEGEGDWSKVIKNGKVKNLLDFKLQELEELYA